MTEILGSGCRLEGRRVIVRLPVPTDAQEITRYFTENHQHLYEFAPVPAEYCSQDFWQVRAEAYQRDLAQDRACKTFLFELDDATVIGSANLSEFVRGPFQAAYLGYAIAARRQGRGLMFEALSLLMTFAFAELELHRVMANYMPRNERSAAVLRRLGFVREGLAHKYLLINGIWEDHVLTSLTSESWVGPAITR